MLNCWLTAPAQLKALRFSRATVKRARMTKLNDRSSLLAFLKSRKSASAKAMKGPGPDAYQLHDMLEIAVRVPDHGKLNPWRFIMFVEDERAKVGDKFAQRYAALHPDYPADAVNFQKQLFMRAPVVVAVVSAAAEHVKIPVWEQQLSSAAVCFNLVLAAQAYGFDAQWQTDWVAYDDGAKSIMGLKPGENIAGLVYIGTSAAPLEDRPRPDVNRLVTRWSA
jgi:nitroreductase